MAKRDFSSVDTNPVYSTLAEAAAEPAADTGRKSRRIPTEAEAKEALENMQTTGKKGVRLKRINMAFAPANYEFIRIMAQVRGQTLTEFVNDILNEARRNHADIYEQAIRFRNSL